MTGEGGEEIRLLSRLLLLVTPGLYVELKLGIRQSDIQHWLTREKKSKLNK